MTFTAKPALLALLSLGVALPLAAPAVAQQAGDAVTFTVNQDVRKAQAEAKLAFDQVAVLISASGGRINASNSAQVLQALATTEAPIAAVEAAAKTNDELFIAQELRYRKDSTANAARFYADNSAGVQERIRLAPQLDRLIANPSTPRSAIGDYAFERGHIAYLAQKYHDALPMFQRAKAAGNTNPMLDAFIVDSKVKLKDYSGAATDMAPVIARMKAAGQKPPESLYMMAIEQAYRAKSPLATQYELAWNADYPSPKNWHDSLIRLQTRGQPFDSRQRLEVWRLMRASNVLADEKEKQLYAKDAQENGLTRESAAVLKGVSADTAAGGTTKGKAKGKGAAAKAPLGGDPTALATKAKAASDAQSAQTAGNAAYADGNYPLAVEMFKLAQTRGATDKDGLLLSLGAAQAQSGDKPGAQANFQAVTGSPRKDVAAYWLAYIARP